MTQPRARARSLGAPAPAPLVRFGRIGKLEGAVGRTALREAAPHWISWTSATTTTWRGSPRQF